MRQNSLLVLRTRKHEVTTDSNHKFNIAPNLQDRHFMADQPNQKWAGDITYIRTREGGLYLAVIHRPAGFCAANAERDGPAFKACDRPLMVCKQTTVW